MKESPYEKVSQFFFLQTVSTKEFFYHFYNHRRTFPLSSLPAFYTFSIELFIRKKNDYFSTTSFDPYAKKSVLLSFDFFSSKNFYHYHSIVPFLFHLLTFIFSSQHPSSFISSNFPSFKKFGRGRR